MEEFCYNCSHFAVKTGATFPQVGVQKLHQAFDSIAVLKATFGPRSMYLKHVYTLTLRQLWHLQRRDGCWMFGHTGRCDDGTLLITAFCTLAAIDLLLTMARTVLGTEASGKSKRFLPSDRLLHMKLSVLHGDLYFFAFFKCSRECLWTNFSLCTWDEYRILGLRRAVLLL